MTLSPGCSDLEWCEMYLAHKGQNIEQTLHEHLQAVSEGCLASVVNSHINPAIILKLKLPHIESLALNFAD